MDLEVAAVGESSLAYWQILPAATSHSYLNCGSYGPLPTATADELCRITRLVEMQGMMNPDVLDELAAGYAFARGRIATLVNAGEDEIALTGNVSAGVNVVASGLDWRAGDEVIMTDEEHPSGGLPWVSLARQKGVTLKLLSLTGDPAGIVDRLEELITPRTRLIFVSHVSCFSGLRTPVAEISALARSRGILSMIDGAHAVGVVAVDVREMGCDFYAANCHKWLFGPLGTGFLYVRKDRLDELALSWVGAGSTTTWSVPDLPFEPQDGAQRFEFGSHPLTLFAALGKSLDLIESLGVAEIQAYSAGLTTKLKTALRDLRGVTVRTPFPANQSAGLVSFYVTGLTEPDPGERLWREHGIIVASRQPEERWLRVAAACFVLDEELERLVELLSEWQPGG